ncbi:MAG: diguanylate cyclase, partial [Clostridia bacterium]
MSDTAPYPLNDIAKNLVSNIQGGVIICQYCAQAQAFKTLYISDGWKTLTGYTLLELEERFDGNARALILPEDIEQATRSYIEQTSRDSYYQLEYRFRHKDGHIVWAIDYGIVAHTPDGLAQNQSIVTDISPLKANEEKLRLSEARFRIATKAAHAAVFELDLTVNRYLHIENAEVIFHADEETVLAIVNNAKRGCHPSTYYTNVFRLMHHPDDLRTLENARVQMLQTGISECEVRLHQPNNSYLWCKFLQAVVNDENGNPLRSIGYIADVDEQHRNTAALLSKAESDPLTGLLNKSAIRSKGEQMLSSAPSLAHALFVLDVDNFKHINDSLGHLFGDGVLMDLSAKLRRLFKCDSLLARVGGDEFVVLIRGTLTEEDAAKRAEKICLAFQRSYSGEKAECNISCSVGVALSVPGDSFEQLFHKADRALYHAKEHGKDCYALYRDCAGDHESATELLGDIYIRDAQMSDSGRLQLKERIFELLYRSVDFSSSVNMILSLLGQFLDVNRVYIFENTADNHFFSNIYEWCAEGVTPLRDQLQALPVAKLAYFSRFDSNGIFR